MSEKRLVQLSASFPPRVCGVGDYTSFLTSALRTAGAPVEVWTAQENVISAPHIHAIAPHWDKTGLRTLASDLRSARPALVHLQYERALYEQSAELCWYLPRLLRRIKVPLMTTLHSLDGPAGWGRAHRLPLMALMAGSESIIVCSERQNKALQKLPGLSARTALLPIGNVIPVTASRNRPASDKQVRLVYFGFVWRGRNIETMLHALHAARQTYPDKDIVLEIVGGIRDDAYLQEVTGLAQELQVARHVTFRGALDAPDVSQSLANADVVLLPFATGVSTGRTTLFAALAHQCPLVTMADEDNVSPHFKNNANMILTPTGDTSAFTRAVVRVVGNQGLQDLLSDGAARLAQVFSWPAIAKQMLDLPTYRKALKA